MRTKIAIVDDHQIFRKSLKRLLEDTKDIEIVFEASNGLELMEKLSLPENKVQLILLDIQMPVMDGLKAAEILKINHPEIAIIMLSQLSGEHVVRKSLEYKVNGFFTKDSDPEQLIDVIRKIKKSNFLYDPKLEKHVSKIHDPVQEIDAKEISYDFSRRELEIIRLSSLDINNKDIADRLNISVRTVEGHKSNILKKTGCYSFLGVVILALELNLITKD